MSETGAIGTHHPMTCRQFNGTIGLPLPGIEVAIQNDANTYLPPGDPGNVCTCGPNAVRGHRHRSDPTQARLCPARCADEHRDLRHAD